jgi:hypothetical protein
MDTGGCLPGIKRHESEADHSPVFNAEVKNVGAIPALLQYILTVKGKVVPVLN